MFVVTIPPVDHDRNALSLAKNPLYRKNEKDQEDPPTGSGYGEVPLKGDILRDNTKFHLTHGNNISKLPARHSETAEDLGFSTAYVQDCLSAIRKQAIQTNLQAFVLNPPCGFTPLLMIGLIAQKVGMSRAFLPSGEAVAVTYLKVEPNVVVRTKTKDKDGYNAVVLGIGAKEWKTRKGNQHTRFKVQKEFQVESLDGFEAGKELMTDVLPAESFVTIEGISKGKGFQGVMRRHNFHGGPRSHGSHFKREPGSIGMRTWPGRIFRGHPMAGHMGLEKLTIKHRSVVVNDAGKNIIAVKGPVPGPNGTHVFLTLEASATK